ncbi:MAG: helicase-exonuclease AddAB subunit AddB [Lachnospiraceae bacterium]
MSLQLILGGSGSGKTSLMYKNIIMQSLDYPDKHFFSLVPEQFTMQTQKDIVTMHPNHGTMNIDIVSFQRLAYRIFEELAVENLQVLDDMGKSMVLRKVAAGCKRQLKLFSGHLNQNGFVNQLKSMLSEFYQYGITPETLKDMAPLAATPLLTQKLEDFAVIFKGFADYIEGHYITTEEVLDVLCRVLPESGLIAGSVIALDGYTGFTPVQYRLIELFLVHAEQVMVTVTCDKKAPLYGKVGMHSLFYMSSQVVNRLTETAAGNNIKKSEDIWCEQRPAFRFLESPELDFLQQHLFRYTYRPYQGELSGHLELFQALGLPEEIRCVVHQISRMIQEEGLRYRDIAVVTGDLPGYGREISHQFEQNGIPFFMDDKRNVLDNPMVELIRSALEVIMRDFSYESVFRYLRSGLVTQEQEMTDRMENYVLAFGIRGYEKWNTTWERTSRGQKNLNLTELNAFREQVMMPLAKLKEGFGKKETDIAQMSAAVIQLLDSCRAEDQLMAYQEYFAGQGEYRLAREYSQVYGMVREMLKRLQQLLGDERVSRKEFSRILDAGFEELSLGVIPATVDRVVVGDITRTRLAHVKVLFFVGVNDGIVPMRKEHGTLLSDKEREFFGKHQIELAPTAREDSFRQRFYLYLMMTKPQQKLVVSYTLMGSDGKSRRASHLIGEIRQMFPALKVTECRDEMGEDIYSVAEAKKKLIEGLREASADGTQCKDVLEVYRWFAESEEYQADARKLIDAAFYSYEKQGIGHAAASALYGSIVSGSVTRLEQYAACAYAHFLRYGLELMERQRYELAAADIGNLFHDSIDLCFQKLKENGGDWRTVTDEERSRLVAECVQQVTGEYGNTILNSSSRNAYLSRRVESITQRTVWALQQQIIKGDFTPVGFEVSFSAADNLKAMKISLSEEEVLHLRGRIDRLDLCHDEEHVYVKIIDYKSGSTSFDLAALYYGLQLQLVVYMDAVMELTGQQHPGKEVVPAGIFYYNIQNPVIQKGAAQSPDEIDAEILKKLKMNGLVNSELEVIKHLDHDIEKESDIIPVVLKNDEVQEGRSSVANRERFEKLRTFVQKKLKQTGQEILAGEIGTVPYKSGTRTACDYCPYHAVCGFDKKTSGYEFRRLKSKKTEEVWEDICQ